MAPTGTSSALSSLIEGAPLASATSLELLQIGRSEPGKAVPIFHTTFGDEIVFHIAVRGRSGVVVTEDQAGVPSGFENPAFQVLFLNSVRDNQGCTTNSVKISPQTLQIICEQLTIPLAFIDRVLKPSVWSKQSGGSFHRFDDESELEAIDGFYHYFSEWHLGPLHTWFSYNIKYKCTTYLLIDSPSSVKEKLLVGAEQKNFFTQPLVIDQLIAEECALWREEFINDHYNQIFDWHERNGSMDPPLRRHVNSVDNLQRLHQLSRTWNMIYEDLGDLSERLVFLTDTTKKIEDAGLKTTSTMGNLRFI